MSLDKILVVIFSFFGILFTFWFFLMKREKVIEVSDLPAGRQGEVDILVEGGYNPEVISIKRGKLTKINFLRKDPSSCLEEVVLPDFRIRKTLPLNQKVSIEITPQKTGEFKFECGMNMFHGKLIVK